MHKTWTIPALLTLAALPLSASSLFVTLNTTALQGNPDAPFYLNFQLNGDAGNDATLSAFSGFGPLQSADGLASFGDYTASSTQVTLSTHSTAFNSVVIPFTPGAMLSFHLNLSEAGSVFPDLFSFAILRSGLAEIPTDPNTAAGLFGALLTVEILGPGQVNVSVAGGDPLQPPYDQLPAPLAMDEPAGVPEPATFWLCTTALAVLIARSRAGRAARPQSRQNGGSKRLSNDSSTLSRRGIANNATGMSCGRTSRRGTLYG